ncbi:MAG: hypothetical protein HRU21_12460, partial [Pseudomonadales bacterium]|nr:hypothetical protein [Pseudomonadales bacterium]
SGALGISRLYDMSYATVDADVTADNIAINARANNQSDEDAAVELMTYNVGVGGTAIGVSYADVRSSHIVEAGLKRATSNDTVNDNGTLRINAIDSTELRIGDTRAEVSDEASDGMFDLKIGAGVAGVSVAIAEKDAKVKAWMGDYDDNGTVSVNDDRFTVINGYSQQDISAKVEGQIRAKAFAAAAGLFVGLQGVGTEARDYSSANTVLAGFIGAGEGTVNAVSLASPETYSRAYGVTVSGLGSAGASVANAFADTQSTVTVNKYTYFSDNASLNINAQTGDGVSDNYVSANAQAFAASGAIFVGVGAAQANAENTAATHADIGDYVYLPADDFIVNARNYSRQIADADGYAVGALAVGYTESFATSQTSSGISMGLNPAGFNRYGDFVLDVVSVDENQAFTVAGGGGFVSGNAAISNADTLNKSATQKAAYIDIADWQADSNTLPLSADQVRISAYHESNFYAATDSTTTSVVGGSGAEADVDVDNDADVKLGENVHFDALAIDIDARNTAKRLEQAWDNAFEANVFAGSGGGANGTAGLSYNDLSGINSSVSLDDNVTLTISSLAWLDPGDAHDITIDASSRFFIRDTSKVEVGGVLQGAGARSEIDLDANNSITIGDDVVINNNVGAIGIGTYTTGSAMAEANVAVWSAAGIAGGDSNADITFNNIITIGEDVSVNAREGVGIYAGRSSDYFAENQVSSSAFTNVYNWSAYTTSVGSTAIANVNADNRINFGDNISIGSDKDVNIQANQGSIYSEGVGREHNTWQAIGNDVKEFGSDDANSDDNIVFDGSGQIVAGQSAYQYVNINKDGVFESSVDATNSPFDSVRKLDQKYSSRATLAAYIAELQALVDEYSAWQETTVSNEQGDIASGDVDSDGNNLSGSGSSQDSSNSQSSGAVNPYEQEIIALRNEISDLSVIVDSLSSIANDVIEVRDFYASAGNINIVADDVALNGNSQNKPNFIARGDAEILIDNKSDK